jgi:S-DNA-T family DNA segregation ATPase FtsK/SpoIIIE
MTKEEKTTGETPSELKIEPEQLSFVPIDSFQQQPQAAQQARPEPKKKEEVDDIEPLDFDILQEVEDEDYELPPATLLNAVPPTDQSSEYKKIEKYHCAGANL